MTRNRISWWGRFTVARRIWQAPADGPHYTLCGELSGVRAGRQIELTIARERLQSLCINLTAEADLFPRDTSEADDVARLRMLVHLGVPEDYARELTALPLKRPEDAPETWPIPVQEFPTPSIRFLG